jgi:hypothetical protein
MCGHDRHRFGVGGTGRISIGLYSLFLEKWLEHFAPEQFLVLRMEDYDADPIGHVSRIFDFLGLPAPVSWEHILEDKVFNENKLQRYAFLDMLHTLCLIPLKCAQRAYFG